jgi:hypothetical protein
MKFGRAPTTCKIVFVSIPISPIREPLSGHVDLHQAGAIRSKSNDIAAQAVSPAFSSG